MKTNKYGVANLSVQLPPATVKAFRKLAKANGQSASSRGRMLILADLAAAFEKGTSRRADEATRAVAAGTGGTDGTTKAADGAAAAKL